MNEIYALVTLDDFDRNHFIKWAERTIPVYDWSIFYPWAAGVLRDQDTVDRYLDVGWSVLHHDYLVARNRVVLGKGGGPGYNEELEGSWGDPDR